MSLILKGLRPTIGAVAKASAGAAPLAQRATAFAATGLSAAPVRAGMAKAAPRQASTLLAMAGRTAGNAATDFGTNLAADVTGLKAPPSAPSAGGVIGSAAYKFAQPGVQTAVQAMKSPFGKPPAEAE